MSPPEEEPTTNEGSAPNEDSVPAEGTDPGEATVRNEQAASPGGSTASDVSTVDALDDHLPEATVDSRWWYWIAAVPVYFVVSLILAALLFGVAVLGMFVDAAAPVLLLFALFVVLGVIPGLVLTVMFPLAVYVDAKAVAAADVDWHPDPVLYGLVALAGVLVTAFTVSIPLALYYLYQRHKYVGTP